MNDCTSASTPGAVLWLFRDPCARAVAAVSEIMPYSPPLHDSPRAGRRPRERLGSVVHEGNGGTGFRRNRYIFLFHFTRALNSSSSWMLPAAAPPPDRTAPRSGTTARASRRPPSPPAQSSPERRDRSPAAVGRPSPEAFAHRLNPALEVLRDQRMRGAFSGSISRASRPSGHPYLLSVARMRPRYPARIAKIRPNGSSTEAKAGSITIGRSGCGNPSELPAAAPLCCRRSDRACRSSPRRGPAGPPYWCPHIPVPKRDSGPLVEQAFAG